MADNDETCRSLDRRGRGGDYHGVERRRNLDQGSFVMMTIYRSVFYGILVFNIVLSATVLNLTYFAKQGPRYTAADGDHDRYERNAADAALSARITVLQALVEEHCIERQPDQ